MKEANHEGKTSREFQSVACSPFKRKGLTDVGVEVIDAGSDHISDQHGDIDHGLSEKHSVLEREKISLEVRLEAIVKKSAICEILLEKEKAKNSRLEDQIREREDELRRLEDEGIQTQRVVRSEIAIRDREISRLLEDNKYLQSTLEHIVQLLTGDREVVS